MKDSILNKEIRLPKLGEERSEQISSILFLSGAVLMIVGGIMGNSMFDFGFSCKFRLQNIARLLFAAKLLIFDRKNKTLCLFGLPFILISIMVYFVTRLRDPVSLVLMAFSASGIRFDRIAKTYFFTAASCLAFTIVCSLTGSIEDLLYRSSYGISYFDLRHSFGIIYPTDLASYIFFLAVAYCLAFRGKKYGILRVIPLFAVTVLVYLLCITRLDCICMLLLGAGMIVILYEGRDGGSPREKTFRARVNEKLCIWSMPIFAAFITLTSALYSSDSFILSYLNYILSERLAYGKKGFERYRITPFGQYVDMVGNGGKVTRIDPEEYFFLDSSYLYSLMIYGVLLTIGVIAIFVMIGKRYRNDRVMLFCSALVALNCMISHHLTDVSYDFMVTALTAEGGIALSEVIGRFTAKRKKLVDDTVTVPETEPDTEKDELSDSVQG